MRFIYFGLLLVWLNQVFGSGDLFNENTNVIPKSGFMLTVEPEISDISEFNPQNCSPFFQSTINLSEIVFEFISKLNFDIFDDGLQNYRVQILLESFIDLFIDIFETYENLANSESKDGHLQQFSSYLDGLDVDIDAYNVIPRTAFVVLFEQISQNIKHNFFFSDLSATVDELNNIKRSISESNPEELKNGLNILLNRRSEVIEDITTFAPETLSSLILRVHSQLFGISTEFKSFKSEGCEENDEECLSLQEDREAKNFVRILNTMEVVMSRALSEQNPKEFVLSWFNMVDVMAVDFSAANNAIEVIDFIPRKTKYDAEDGVEDIEPAPVSNAELGPKMTDKELERLVMEKLTEILQRQAPPQVSRAANLYQSERNKLEAAMGDETLPEMSQASLLAYLRTSSLPRLINNAIKGKFGVDVLESLALALKVVNEGLGAIELILKLLIKTIQMIRYYTLNAAEFVAVMSEDHSKPIGDSVPLPPSEKKSKFGSIKKMFSGVFSTVKTTKTDPISVGIGLAIRKARLYSTQINSFPGPVLLRIFHTIINEMYRNGGVVRKALTSKSDKTISGLKTRLDDSLMRIYDAVRKSDPLSHKYLYEVPYVIFSEILMEFVSPLKLKPDAILKAIRTTTGWLKPILDVTSDEIQISVLTFILTDSDAEDTMKLAGAVPEFGTILNVFAKKRK